MDKATTIRFAPALLESLLRPLPLSPLGLLLQRLAKSMQERHRHLFLRLEEHAAKTFLVDPTDLPFVFCIRPAVDRPTIEPRRRSQAGPWEARIAGPLAALIGTIHGAYDGDALFFARDIVIEGDTEAVLALRNALDNAELDLLAETAAMLGSVGPAVERIAAMLLPPLSRLTGIALMRTERL